MTPTMAPPTTTLPEEHRSRLDGIVSRMVAAGEPDENIHAVIGDYKARYGAPGIARPALPAQLMNDAQFGQAIATPWDDNAQHRTAALGMDFGPTLTGGVRAGLGAKRVKNAQTFDERAGGMSDVLRGTGEMLSPALPAALEAAPFRTLLTLGAGGGAQAGVESGLRGMGVGPGVSALGSDVAGGVAGGLVQPQVGGAIGRNAGDIARFAIHPKTTVLHWVLDQMRSPSETGPRPVPPPKLSWPQQVERPVVPPPQITWPERQIQPVVPPPPLSYPSPITVKGTRTVAAPPISWPEVQTKQVVPPPPLSYPSPITVKGARPTPPPPIRWSMPGESPAAPGNPPIPPVQLPPAGSPVPANAATFKHSAAHTDLIRQAHATAAEFGMRHADLSAAAKNVYGIDSYGKLSYQQMLAIHEYMLANNGKLPTQLADLK